MCVCEWESCTPIQEGLANIAEQNRSWGANHKSTTETFTDNADKSSPWGEVTDQTGQLSLQPLWCHPAISDLGSKQISFLNISMCILRHSWEQTCRRRSFYLRLTEPWDSLSWELVPSMHCSQAGHPLWWLKACFPPVSPSSGLVGSHWRTLMTV